MKWGDPRPCWGRLPCQDMAGASARALMGIGCSMGPSWVRRAPTLQRPEIGHVNGEDPHTMWISLLERG